MEVAHPARRALQHPFADAVGALAVEVDRLAPRRLVALGEERPEGLERLHAARADVVVDDVEDDAQARAVGGVDEARQAVRAAVGRVRGREVDAVVAPAVVAGELGDRHELDVGDAQLGQRRQPRRGGLEGPLGGEGADVQLVEHGVAQRRGAEAAVGPRERARVDHARGPAQPVGLPARGGVGEALAVEHEPVVVAGAARAPARCARRSPRRPARARRRARGRRRAAPPAPTSGTRRGRRRPRSRPAGAPRGTPRPLAAPYPSGARRLSPGRDGEGQRRAAERLPAASVARSTSR